MFLIFYGAIIQSGQLSSLKLNSGIEILYLGLYLYQMQNSITKKVFIEDGDVAIEDLGEGVSRKIISYDDKLMLVKVIFEKGAIGAMHHHFHTQISYIEKGVFEVTINGDKKVLAAGSSFYVPSDAPHGVICIEAGILLDSFSPARTDFLKQ